MTRISLRVNSVDHDIEVEPRHSLADALRDRCGLTGTHLGCEHGVCGACTVLVGDEPVRACLMFAVQADGRAVRTVEGLDDDGAFNALQQAFHEQHALQCGYCTPGMLMLATWLVERGTPVSDDELREVMSSNLCRCTGYRNILRAVRSVLDGAGS
ncbi:MAG: (2Fe-2S)-binding protein [Alphaproteobacteria bacterium]|nr:(2Fe-2S)-binding protein [Alphaproteobacteria bacterium]